jgi:hypothetical protein
MREILEVLEARNHPVGIVTKSALVMRDIDILSRMAARGLAKVALSVTTLDRRCRAPWSRARRPRRGGWRRSGRWPKPGIPVRSWSRRWFPASTIRDRAHPRFGLCAGAKEAGYIILRLPLEVSADLQGLAAAPLPRPLPPCHVAGPLDARRQGL